MWRALLNLILPQPPHIAALEEMAPTDFRAAIPPLPAQPRAWIFPLFPYEHPLVKHAVWEVKYRGNTRIARLLGALLAEELTALLAERAETENFRAPLLIPIPLARARERARGWNQSALLAQEAARELKEFATLRTDILKKVTDTESQTKSKNRAERMRNLKGCFAVAKPEEVRDTNIILVDDVTTTGATLAEARTTLLAGGARAVLAVTVAH